MTIRGYYTGCPVWASHAWVGQLFTRHARPAEFLRQYAAVFNAVEGNTTFYSVPAPDTVARWLDDTPRHFRFCFKFPQAISHERQLVGADADTERFLQALEPLADRLGPIFLQLPPVFGPSRLGCVARFLEHLPSRFSYAVEVRHAGFFTEPAAEKELNELLRGRGIDRVIFDTRALQAADPRDRSVREAQRQRPRLPVRPVATGTRPFVRYHAHPTLPANLPLFQEWCDRVAEWIDLGLTPYIFFHAMDEQHMPELASGFHRRLSHRLDVGTMPDWGDQRDEPERGDEPREAPGPKQLGLFD